MKSCYFDTTAFNHLNSTDVSYLLSQNKVQIISSSQVLGELSCTFKSNPTKAKKLCENYQKLCMRRIIKPVPMLLKEEFIRSILNLPSNIYLPKGHDLFVILNNLVKGIIDSRTKSFTSSEKIRKKQFVQHVKMIISHMDKKKVALIKAFPTFDDYWSHLVAKSNYLFDTINNLLIGYSIGNATINKYLAQDMINNMNSLPHWLTALRITPLLEWCYIKNTKKPKKGDLFDIGDFTHCTTFGIFVSDDADLRNRGKLLMPKIDIYGLQDFIKRLKGGQL